MLACFTRGSGLDGRGAKRHRIRLRMEGHHSYLANPSPGASLENPARDPSRRPLRVSVMPEVENPRKSVRRPRLSANHLVFSPVLAEEEEQVYSQLSALKDRMPTRCVSRPSRVARRSRSPRGRASVPLPTFRRFPRDPFRLPETPERFLQPRLFAPRAASRVPSPDPSPHRIHPPAPE